MERQQSKSKFKTGSIRRIVELGVLIVLFVVLSLLKRSEKVCEFFARTFSRGWIRVFGTLLGWIPVSFYELFLIAAICGGIAFLVVEIVLMCQKRWRQSLTAVLIVAICVFAFLNIYTSTASFAYNRAPLPTEIYATYSGDDITVEEAEEIAAYIINEANKAYEETEHDEEGLIVYPYSFGELSKRLAEEYKRLDNDYFSSYTPRAKHILNKTIMSEIGISGVFFAPFGEANINRLESGLYLPHTMGHEMAHGKGVMREYQADLVSSYICLTSDDPYIRYGALVECLYTAVSMVDLFPNTSAVTSELLSMINPKILEERSKDSAKWHEYDTLQKIGQFFNDLYLKLNGQQDGTNSYYKPGEVVGTGDHDDDGEAIVQVIVFSGTQNLLINLYKQSLLV